MKPVSTGAIYLLAVVGVAGCASNLSVRSHSLYSANGFDRGALVRGSLGILPVLGDPDKESICPMMGDSLGASIISKWPDVTIVPWRDSLARIDEMTHSNFWEEPLQRALRTGVIDSQFMAQVARTLGVRYLLLVSVGDCFWMDITSVGLRGIKTSRIPERICVSAQVWDAEQRDAVWEATAATFPDYSVGVIAGGVTSVLVEKMTNPGDD